MRLHWGNSYSVSAAMLHFCPFPHNILRTAQKGFREELNFNKAGTIVVSPLAAVKRQPVFAHRLPRGDPFPLERLKQSFGMAVGWQGPAQPPCGHSPANNVCPRPKQTATPASRSSPPGQLHCSPCEQGSELLSRSCLTLWEGFLAEAQLCGVAGVSDPGRCLHSTL